MTDRRTAGLVLDAVFYQVTGLRILNGAYLHTRPGRVCALFGRNGSGKSTLFKVAAGQIRPQSGLLIIDGSRFLGPARRRRFARIAYLPQTSMLPPSLRVRTLIAQFPPAAGVLVADPLLAGHQETRVGELSGGQRRYLEIRLLLSLDRPYLLLDEPFTGIEPLFVENITAVIRRATHDGKGVLITDHYHQYVLPIAQDAYVMQNGQCIALDPTIAYATQLRDLGYLSQRPTLAGH